MSEINELREKMEVITIEMIKLLKLRTDIAKEIGDIKNLTISGGVVDFQED